MLVSRADSSRSRLSDMARSGCSMKAEGRTPAATTAASLAATPVTAPPGVPVLPGPWLGPAVVEVVVGLVEVVVGAASPLPPPVTDPATRGFHWAGAGPRTMVREASGSAVPGAAVVGAPEGGVWGWLPLQPAATRAATATAAITGAL